MWCRESKFTYSKCLMAIGAMGSWRPNVSWTQLVKGGAQSSPFPALNRLWNQSGTHLPLDGQWEFSSHWPEWGSKTIINTQLYRNVILAYSTGISMNPTWVRKCRLTQLYTTFLHDVRMTILTLFFTSWHYFDVNFLPNVSTSTS